MLKNNGRSQMSISRRTILKGAGALPLVAGNFGFAALRADAAGRPERGRNSADPVRAWQWRPRGAVDDRRCGGWNPTAFRATACSRSISPIRWRAPTIPWPQPNRSSTEDQRRELGEAITGIEDAAPVRRAWRWSAIRAAAIRSAAISRTAAAPMSATPCCAAFPIMASLTGTTASATSSTAAVRSCAG